jgi:hypothetical protein
MTARAEPATRYRRGSAASGPNDREPAGPAETSAASYRCALRKRCALTAYPCALRMRCAWAAYPCALPMRCAWAAYPRALRMGCAWAAYPRAPTAAPADAALMRMMWLLAPVAMFALPRRPVRTYTTNPCDGRPSGRSRARHRRSPSRCARRVQIMCRCREDTRRPGPGVRRRRAGRPGAGGAAPPRCARARRASRRRPGPGPRWRETRRRSPGTGCGTGC